MKYAVFIPWLGVALVCAFLLLAVEIAEKLIGYIHGKIEDHKALHSGKRFYVS